MSTVQEGEMLKLIRLFEPGEIGKMEVRNRIVMSPMGNFYVDAKGFITPQAIDYYMERAKGGVGLIESGATSVLREAATRRRAMLYDDKFIPRFRELAAAVHKHGARMSLQLHHGGPTLVTERLARGDEVDDIGPSAVPWVRAGVAPKEATREDIRRVVRGFTEAALRVKAAGLDAVSIHGGHGYLISSFLSPLLNRRTDEYGGSAEKRAHFACEVIAAIRKKVGPDFPIIFRFSGNDFLPGGITLEDSLRQTPLFVEAGVDALHVSASVMDSTEWQFLCYLFPAGAVVHLAEQIKKVVKVPVITVGKIGDPLLAESILREGKADFIAMGRALIADPALPNKAREGRLDDICRCIYCNNCTREAGAFLHRDPALDESSFRGLSCTVNPAVGREREFALTPTSKPKKVMVVGGGLAGMEAARVLAERCHQVVLYEKSDKLGGQWNIAVRSPFKEELFPTVTQRLEYGLEKAGVKVVLNKEVTGEFVEKEQPEAVVVATGAVPLGSPVSNIGNQNVVQATDVFTSKAEVGQRVVVIGGRLRGMEVADLLANQGKKVSLVTLKALGENGSPVDRHILRQMKKRLLKLSVTLFPYSSVHEIREKGVYINYGQDLIFLKADTVVLAVGAKPENHIVFELKRVVPELYAIGDCVTPRDAMYAICEGAEVGRKI